MNSTSGGPLGASAARDFAAEGARLPVSSGGAHAKTNETKKVRTTVAVSVRRMVAHYPGVVGGGQTDPVQWSCRPCRATNSGMGVSRFVPLCLPSLLLLLAGCFGDFETVDVPEDAPRKILFISVDTTRADRLASYGYDRPTTPSMDALAETGVRFANAYSVMPTTDPSHTSMLTCQYPRTHGVMRNAARRQNPKGPSLAAWLSKRGYETAAITARLGLDPKLRGISGFDHADSPELPVRHREAVDIVGRARQWFSEREGDRWFLWVHLWEPHKPYTPMRVFRDRFAPGVPEGNARFEDPTRFLKRRETLSKKIVMGARKLYDAEIALADNAVGAIVGMAGQAAPVDGDLLIVLVSDHGESLAERQSGSQIGFGHGALVYDEVVKVPWLLNWKGRVSPAVIDTAVSLVDLTPTVAQLVDPGARVSKQCDGRSLADAVLSGESPEAVPIVLDRRLFRSHPLPGLRYEESAWIDYPWKVIVNEGAERPELYRLDTDPDETTDLVEKEPERAASLAGALKDWKLARPLKADSGPKTREAEQEEQALRALGYID
jgi:arylsulfatase A-like enzyme